jgi:outer membrane lipoprotein-sorting protein
MPRLLPLLLSAAVLQAQGPLPSLKEAVERFDAAQARVNTLQAPFTLTTRRALLRTPTVTKGTLYLQGSDFAHFAFAPPEDLILHLTPKALMSYSPQAKAGEFIKIGIIKNANRKFLGLGQKLSVLQEVFQIGVGQGADHPGAILLTLQPRTLGLKKRFQVLNLWVDRDTWLPTSVQWVERSGDSWLLELGTLTLNPALPASVTCFKIPPDIPLRTDFTFFASRKK